MSKSKILAILIVSVLSSLNIAFASGNSKDKPTVITKIKTFDTNRPDESPVINITIKKKKSDLLLEDYSKKLAKNPKDIKTYLARGTFYYKQGFFDLGLEDLKKIVELDKTNKDGKILLEKMLKVLNRDNDSENAELKTEVEKLLKGINTELEKAKKKNDNSQNKDDSITSTSSKSEPYSEKIKQDPKDVNNYFLRSQFYYKEKNFEASINDLNKILELDNENSSAKLSLSSIVKELKEQIEKSTKENRTSLEKIVKNVKLEQIPSKNKDEIGFPRVSFYEIKDDNKIKLSTLKGKVILVNFFATWYNPCKEDMKKVNELYDKYNSDGLEVVGVSTDRIKNAEIISFTQKLKINYPIALQNRESRTIFGNLELLPTSFLIDTEGKVVKIFKGTTSKSTLEREIYKLLGY
jgi:peroxiredoxin